MNLAKWVIAIALMLRIVGSTLSLVGSGQRSVVAATDGSQRVGGRDEHGLGLDRTGSGLKPILAVSGLDRTAIFFTIGGSGLDQD